MSQTPYLAVILEGGQLHSVLLQEWPEQIPPPRIVVVDYDIDGVDEEELTHFSIGNQPQVALCRSEIPDRYEDYRAALSPKALWAALGEPVDSADSHEKRRQTPIEQSLTAYLTGYLHHDPARREQLPDCSDWPCMARRELDRRSARFLEALPDDLLGAIAQGEVDLTGLAGKIPA
ncbi:MAG: hypothetical protein LBI87_14495 [Candidatus Accumulibacter sp.]|jgi:hypothetical protein|nr:hypothetical protein [Accumulibacter sp.]